MLLARGHIDQHQLASALAHQRQAGGRIGHSLVAMGFVAESVFLSTRAVQLSGPFIVIGDRRVPQSVLRLVPEKLLRTRRILPLALASKSKRDEIIVALSQPDDLRLLDEIAFVTGRTVRPVLAAEGDIDRALARHLDGGPEEGTGQQGRSKVPGTTYN